MAQARRPSVDDVRAAFYAQAPPQQWIREVRLEPLELVVGDDHATVAMRVPVRVSASGEITFGRPRRVRVEYVLADAARVDASRMVYASAADTTGTPASARQGADPMPTPMISDRPRRPGEDVTSWAVRTGRVLPGPREAFWRRQVAASAAAARTLEKLTPAVPGSEPRPVTAAATAADGEDAAEGARLDAWEAVLHSPATRTRDQQQLARARQDRAREVAAGIARQLSTGRQVAAATTDGDDAYYDELDEQMLSPQLRPSGRERARREHLRRVVEGRTVGLGYTRDQIAARQPRSPASARSDPWTMPG
jgi:hypothetical protein